MTLGRFVDCVWSCEKCDKRGEVCIWARLEESDDMAAERERMALRGRCFEGCAMDVRPLSGVEAK
jgi:hypothetical protein